MTKLKDTKHKKGYVVINETDVKALELDWETITSKELNDYVRAELSLPIREKVSKIKEEIDDARIVLGLDENTSTKEVIEALKVKAFEKKK